MPRRHSFALHEKESLARVDGRRRPDVNRLLRIWRRWESRQAIPKFSRGLAAQRAPWWTKSSAIESATGKGLAKPIGAAAINRCDVRSCNARCRGRNRTHHLFHLHFIWQTAFGGRQTGLCPFASISSCSSHARQASRRGFRNQRHATNHPEGLLILGKMLHVELVTRRILRTRGLEPHGFGFVREEHEPVFFKLNVLQLKAHPQCDVIRCQHQGIFFPDRFNGGVGPVYLGGLGV